MQARELVLTAGYKAQDLDAGLKQVFLRMDELLGEERWRDADSILLLVHATRLVAGAGLAVANVDVTVVCERPRIGPHVAAMREHLAAALNVGGRIWSVGSTSLTASITKIPTLISRQIVITLEQPAGKG